MYLKERYITEMQTSPEDEIFYKQKADVSERTAIYDSGLDSKRKPCTHC